MNSNPSSTCAGLCVSHAPTTDVGLAANQTALASDPPLSERTRQRTRHAAKIEMRQDIRTSL
jgi:hypothetical protein